MGMELSELPSKLATVSAFAQPTCGGWSARTKADLLGFGCLYYSFIWLQFLLSLPMFIKIFWLHCLVGARGSRSSYCMWLRAHQALLSSFVEITVQKLYCEKCMNILFEHGVYSNCMCHKLMELKPTILIQQNLKKREHKGMKLNYLEGSTYTDRVDQ